MKHLNRSFNFFLASFFLFAFSSCTCDVQNSYNWTNQAGSAPPQAMLDELTSILNDDNCNPHLLEECDPNAANFKELILGNTPAEAVQDNYGGQFGGSNGSEDFTIMHKVVNLSSITTQLSSTELNQIKNVAINRAKESAPYCSCQSRRARIVNIQVKEWEQTFPPETNDKWRRSLYITVKYHCCGACA